MMTTIRKTLADEVETFGRFSQYILNQPSEGYLFLLLSIHYIQIFHRQHRKWLTVML
jgi:hypothetical protein